MNITRERVATATQRCPGLPDRRSEMAKKKDKKKDKGKKKDKKKKGKKGKKK